MAVSEISYLLLYEVSDGGLDGLQPVNQTALCFDGPLQQLSHGIHLIGPFLTNVEQFVFFFAMSIRNLVAVQTPERRPVAMGMPVCASVIVPD